MKDKYGNVIDESKETNEKGGVVLNADQMAELTTGITAALTDAQTAKDEALEAEALAAKEKGNKTPEDKTPFNMDEMAAKVIELVKEGTAEDQNRVFATLWNEKLAGAMQATPGLESYMNGQDDYAEVRMEKLNRIEKYDDKLKALAQLQKSYKQALAGTGGRKPIIDHELEKRVEENQEGYDKVNEKWMNGEYKTESEFANGFFGMLGKEIAAAK